MTPTIAVIDAPVVDPVRVLLILLRCKASRFLIHCRDSRYREPLHPAEPTRSAPIKQIIDADGQSLNVGVPGSGRANQETRGHGRVFRHNVTGSQSSLSSAAEPTYRVPTRILRLEKLAMLV